MASKIKSGDMVIVIAGADSNPPKTGTVLLAADAIYTGENEAGVIPGITWNTAASMQAIDRLKQIRDARQGQLWYSHDAEQHAQNAKTKVFD